MRVRWESKDSDQPNAGRSRIGMNHTPIESTIDGHHGDVRLAPGDSAPPSLACCGVVPAYRTQLLAWREVGASGDDLVADVVAAFENHCGVRVVDDLRYREWRPWRPV